jgi:lipopolysaccharide assembly outer membrane protein LptD (OstA)
MPSRPHSKAYRATARRRAPEPAAPVFRTLGGGRVAAAGAARLGSALSPYLKQPGEELPTFISADRISGKTTSRWSRKASVEMRKRNSILLGERLVYRQTEDEVEATGDVRLSRDGDRISGPSMKMRLDDSTGTFEQPSYSIRRIKTGSAATLWTGSEERESSALTTGTGAARAWSLKARASIACRTRLTAPARRQPAATQTGLPAPPTCALTTTPNKARHATRPCTSRAPPSSIRPG